MLRTIDGILTDIEKGIRWDSVAHRYVPITTYTPIVPVPNDLAPYPPTVVDDPVGWDPITHAWSPVPGGSGTFTIETNAAHIGVETFGAAAAAGSQGTVADAGHVHSFPLNTSARGQALGTTSGPTTVSTTYVDLPDMSVTLTSNGGDLGVWLSGEFANSGLNGAVLIALSLDGAAEVAPIGGQSAVATDAFALATQYLFTGVAAGAHTITGRWLVDSNTGTATGTRRQLLVMESR